MTFTRSPQGTLYGRAVADDTLGELVVRVAPVRLCDGLAARRLVSATTKRSEDSNEIEPINLVGY